MTRFIGVLVSILSFFLSAMVVQGEEALYQAKPVEVAGFTEGIEGPACDREGNLYAVAFQQPENIGRITPQGKAEIYLALPNKSYGNGIVFDRAGSMFIADYSNHNVLQVNLATKQISVFAHEPKMNQPNDLAQAPNGTLYASDPSWSHGTGQLWSISTKGEVTLLAKDLGTTNGIEVSPNGRTLYVNESKQRGVWTFPILADNKLGERKLLKQFDDHGFDGMRADIDGNLYITRYGKGTVAVLSPAGKVLREIEVLGAQPSNLCFGGADGCTVYVTEVQHRRVVSFRTERPGLAWQRLHEEEKK